MLLYSGNLNWMGIVQSELGVAALLVRLFIKVLPGSISGNMRMPLNTPQVANLHKSMLPQAYTMPQLLLLLYLACCDIC